jgi:hypothetical protein
MPIIQTAGSISANDYGLSSANQDIGAYVAIQTFTGNGTASSYTFSNIPQIYTHLQLRYFARTTYSSIDTIYLYNYNNSGTSSNSSYHALTSDGSTSSNSTGTGSFSSVISSCPGSSQTTGIFGAGIIDILNYTNTSIQKTVRGIGGYDASGSGSIWQSGNTPIALGTGAVTNLTILANSNFVSGSYFSLYGVK